MVLGNTVFAVSKDDNISFGKTKSIAGVVLNPPGSPRTPYICEFCSTLTSGKPSLVPLKFSWIRERSLLQSQNPLHFLYHSIIHSLLFPNCGPLKTRTKSLCY